MRRAVAVVLLAWLVAVPTVPADALAQTGTTGEDRCATERADLSELRDVIQDVQDRFKELEWEINRTEESLARWADRPTLLDTYALFAVSVQNVADELAQTRLKMRDTIQTLGRARELEDRYRQELVRICDEPADTWIDSSGNIVTRLHVNRPPGDDTIDDSTAPITGPPGAFVRQATIVDPRGKSQEAETTGKENTPGRGWSRSAYEISAAQISREFIRVYTTTGGERRLESHWTFNFGIEAEVPDVIEPGVPFSISVDGQASPLHHGKLYKSSSVGISWKGFELSEFSSSGEGDRASVGYYSGTGDQLGDMESWEIVPLEGAGAYELTVVIGGWGPAIRYVWERQEETRPRPPEGEQDGTGQADQVGP